MIDIQKPEECCGCTACASVCAHDAITMKPDALGLLYPVVDMSKCVECSLCDRVCQFHDSYDKSQNLPEPLAFAARHKDENEVMKSRSGATFLALSDYILEQGGVVYGAGYKDHFRVVHKRALTKEERDEFRGSKYVQSDMSGVFRQVRADLKRGSSVLFSGTPCQTAGLKSFLGNRGEEKLYLVDIVCCGVPGPYVWRDYIAWIEKKNRKKISAVNFRDKELYGWSDQKETYIFEGEKTKRTLTVFTDFYHHFFYRQSCGVCHFTNLQRPSDLTLADYWGWKRVSKDFNADNKGCSLVLCNTAKGCELFDKIKSRMNVIPANLNDVMQDHLSRPSAINPEREAFERLYIRKGFEPTMKAFAFIGYKRYLKQFSLRLRRKIEMLLH